MSSIDEFEKEYLYHYKAVVTDVYDGDTITLDIDLGLGIWKRNVKVRLADIDAPEIRGEERPFGLVVENYLSGKILDKEVVIQTRKDKSGKYGRLIADVYYKGLDVSNDLVEKGYAVFKEY